MSQPTPPIGNAESPRPLGARRWLNIALGLAFVGLAGLGVVLPVLPTTPFLILASACFVRSSPRLNSWLLGSPLFGPMLRDWQHHRRVRRRVKHIAAVMLIVAVGLSAWLGQFTWPWMVALIVLALVGLAVVMRLPEKSRWTLEEVVAQSVAPGPVATAAQPAASADVHATPMPRLDRDAAE